MGMNLTLAETIGGNPPLNYEEYDLGGGGLKGVCSWYTGKEHLCFICIKMWNTTIKGTYRECHAKDRLIVLHDALIEYKCLNYPLIEYKCLISDDW
jgi:hypothetical protein